MQPAEGRAVDLTGETREQTRGMAGGATSGV